MATSVIAPFRPFKHTSSADPSFAALEPEAAHQRGARQVCPTWTEDGTRGWMDRRRDRQAGRQTDTQTYTGIILCVILSWRVRVPSRERQTCSEFSHQRGCGAETVRACERVFFFFFSPTAIKCDQQRRPHSVHQLSFIWESAYVVRSTRLSVCVYACVIAWQMGRSYKRTAQIRILPSCVCVRALVSKPNCSSVTVSSWAVAG